MRLCSICKKNVATVYTAKIENGKTEMIGLCMECARKMGIPVVDQLMQQAGITPEAFENITEQMNNVLSDINPDEINNNNFLTSLIGGVAQVPKGDGAKEQ
ncbi:MAG TPA: chaperone ClpB, partial [Clostridiaceae bacterium]|nr:chaperone ClpB [Clostridiaceae bacterium]